MRTAHDLKNNKLKKFLNQTASYIFQKFQKSYNRWWTIFDSDSTALFTKKHDVLKWEFGSEW